MTTIDLFSGCGGLSLGFEQAGIQVTAAFEIWEPAAKCYEENFKHPVHRIDLSNVDAAVAAIRPYAPQMIIGGPPCQDFSQAGKRIEADRANLSASYAEIIDILKPKYFVMENVDRAQHSKAFAYAKSVFNHAGYGLSTKVLDASLCGAPQKRKRFFCIGALNKPDGWLDSILVKGLAKKPMTIRDYLGEDFGVQYYYRHPRNYSRRGIFSIDEPAPTMRGVNRPVPKGYPGHPNDACPLSDDLRALSTYERSRIQTFPPTFRWVGSKTDIEQMIGNAVPVKLGEYVARAILEYEDACSSGIEPFNKKEFAAYLATKHNYQNRTMNDICSRLKRADGMLPLPNNPDDYYIFSLEHCNQFIELSAPVKSQIKKAIELYCEFCKAS